LRYDILIEMEFLKIYHDAIPNAVLLVSSPAVCT